MSKIYIVLGFLGSGKTTFLEQFVSSKSNEKNAILVNEYSENGVDDEILKKFSPELVNGGSILCSCRSEEFVQTMLEISKSNPDNIIIEASGITNPHNLYDLIDFIRNEANGKLELAGVITICDATNIEKALLTVHLMKLQVAIADLLVINKIDLVSSKDLKRIQNTLSSLNDKAKIQLSTYGKLESYSITHMKLPLPEAEFDINKEKYILNLNGNYSLDELNEVSKKLNRYVNRIKGIVEIDNKKYIYQYINDKHTLKETNSKKTPSLTIISINGGIKEKVQSICNKNKFIKIS